jgi:hypothetical protein
MHTNTGALKVLTLLEKAKRNRCPSLAVLRRAAEVENVDDTVRKYENLIHQSIEQLKKLNFYNEHLKMVDFHLKRRQSKGTKRLKAALRMPIGYYWGGKCFPLIVIHVMTCWLIFTI